MKIKKIAIVGGGAAGWLSANHLGLELMRDPEIQITVVESKDIPVIGVGEGTVPAIRNSLQRFGISEAELLLETDATFKTGVKFYGWMSSSFAPEANFYYHSFDLPFPGGFDVTPYWMSNKGVKYSELSKAYSISEGNFCPKRKDSPSYQGVVNYAYHFDASKFTALLARNAKTRFGVQHKFETVDNVLLHDDGFIKGLQYQSGDTEEFDFYIDCSGFSSLIFDRALGVKFIDLAHQIPTDTALAMPVKTRVDDEIFPYTKATAHTAGWIWDIPLSTRRGTGFVYSSAHMTEDEALRSFSSYHGVDLDNQDVKKVAMKAGYREKLWQKNCVALGLAGGFVEPLEATSLYVTDTLCAMLAKRFPVVKDDITLYSKSCNELAEVVWGRVIDFIRLHYAISNRRDSDFWHDVTEQAPVSDLLNERLNLWRYAIPQRTDFPSTHEIFLVESYLMVLYGMDYSTRPLQLSDKVRKLSQAAIDNHLTRATTLTQTLMSQKQWLAEFTVFAKNSTSRTPGNQK
ncbi:tryptophan 7-halogenase [Gilvimarinus sp. SDUM040013]|uniref:Tryptophan halogenase family protein n=1 Tax=Gilvimarinus gilvus TaxID=3058038 RepID=A0ABU4RSF5_9GAMM|nr:tryptophan halogenase family protein [Gilvimarinus sp. SDUM040013]MDO3388263.1 tryptophan 7-halogenase [Gilvimarinus sp. SDUM040013]MDX6847813.1 tryptophan halogenase family protein [Gilvimarinus sp. SDUM040013]